MEARYPLGASLAGLERDALSAILHDYYPEVQAETESMVLAKYTNPWTLQLFCELDVFSHQYPELCLAADRIDDLPDGVRDLHIWHWNQLPDAHKVNLGIASFMIADSEDSLTSEELGCWDHRLVRQIVPALQIRRLDPVEAITEIERASSAHGWVRELDEHLRAFSKERKRRLRPTRVVDTYARGYRIRAASFRARLPLACRSWATKAIRVTGPRRF